MSLIVIITCYWFHHSLLKFHYKVLGADTFCRIGVILVLQVVCLLRAQEVCQPPLVLLFLTFCVFPLFIGISRSGIFGFL
ncbi:hypothetical protein FKM82_023250 [Ascaphus truei]